MGRLFLNVWLRYIFDLCVFMHFLAILISYVLAGSEAWGGVRVLAPAPFIRCSSGTSRPLPACFRSILIVLCCVVLRGRVV
jgi:hypothetical protein